MKFTLALFLFVLIAASAKATTIHVPADQPTIAAGLAAASAGDTVLVACGTYDEHGMTMPSGVVLLGETGDPACVVIDGQLADLLFTCTNTGPGTQIEGITLTRGGGGGGMEGGAIRVAAPADLALVNCDFTDNEGWIGGSLYWEGGGGHLTLRGCRFTGFYENCIYGGATYIWGTEADPIELVVERCEFRGLQGSQQAGAIMAANGHVLVDDCLFDGNSVPNADYAAGAALCLLEVEAEITNSRFLNNHSMAMDGGTIDLHNMNGQCTISGCEFRGNTAGWSAQGVALNIDVYYGSIRILDCLFADNATVEGYEGTLVMLRGDDVLLNRCTFAGNQLRGGRLIYAYSMNGYDHSVQRGIIANNLGCSELFQCYSGNPVLGCSDVYGNELGDYTGCLAGQEGANGNFSLNPAFCDPAGGDYRLDPWSPCAPAYGCGLIGSEFVCSGAWAGITGIVDVPDDQGGQLRLTWAPHELDSPGGGAWVTEYAIWRHVDARGERTPPGDWEFVTSVPAIMAEEYIAVCPTLCDSTAAGACWTSFYLTAHTPEQGVFFECAPDSGQSVDNLAPSVPENLRFADEHLLAWDPPADEDFRYFSVYGSDTDELDESAVLLDRVTGTGLDVSSAPHVYYHVTATDFSGNEGAAATISPLTDAEGAAPLAFALHGNVPNPFNPSTEIRFDLPEPSAVSLRVYDAAGRLVRTLLTEEPRAAGRHAVSWDGRDASGRAAASGLYLYRLEAGGFKDTRRMTLLK